MRGALCAGETVLLVDPKRRRYLITLVPGATFHSHAGTLAHDEIIGQPAATQVRTSLGAPFLAVRPTLEDFVLKMRRGAQVIYPKDIGPILVYGDVFPGARVFESGVGSGALTIALLRAVSPDGVVLGYERRPDFADRARRNIEAFFGNRIGSSGVPLVIEERDAYDGIDTAPLAGQRLDRVVLDLPEPWQMVQHAEDTMLPGGIFLAYVPTVVQVTRLCDALEHSGFGLTETFEVMRRTWQVKGQSVRPDHRMVAHTGFITHARLLGPQRPR